MFPIWVNDGSSPPPDSDIYYVVAKEGIFLKKKLGMFESMAPVDKISILEPMESQAKMFVRRIPAKQTGQIVNFFREVYKLHRAEAIVILHYNPDTKKYKIEVPNQEVSPGTAVYVSDL
ncbi:hypothetical protein KAR91_35420, partial [Candidatus Pacearchaeota archaeon]|nr:hypothetical protein [Candidatus Pacearchaeota archaeon]